MSVENRRCPGGVLSSFGQRPVPNAMPSAIVVDGGRGVTGDVHVSGSKNSGLALAAAALLASGISTLEGLPPVEDINNMGRILRYFGVAVSRRGDTVQMDATHAAYHPVPPELTRSLRASILVLGPLVARLGRVRLSLPGGCTIGRRPVEEHLRGLKKLGARVKVTDGYIEATASGLQGAVLHLQSPSVTGTANLMMAACLAQGATHIHNAAREPEVVDLTACLMEMGAEIQGAGSGHLTIVGHGRLLSPYRYRVMEDRIEAGTFLILGAIAGTPLTVHPCRAAHQTALIEKLRAVGARVEIGANAVTVRKAEQPVAVDIQTGPYPAFPTDLQLQFMVLLSLVEGISEITETLFELRFSQASGLNKMGANVQVHGNTATISGVPHLSAAEVTGSDLRAAASLVMAAVAARGRSVVWGVPLIDRGYHELEGKLEKIGVAIRRLHQPGEITRGQNATMVSAL